MVQKFPKDFIWGTATASYQIEGAVDKDGRGESIWDRFSRTPGKVVNGDTGDEACDHYHRYEEDVQIMKDMGIDSYRFSIAWPRVFPTGKGKPNPKGLDFYQRLLDELEANGISPSVTLYHWDLPQVLQDDGGWVNRDTAYYFRDYAYYIFSKLGDRVQFWITHNEPWCAAYLGYGNGEHAPGLKNFKDSLLAAHHILYSHGLAVQSFRDEGLEGQIGITLNLTPQYPVSDKPEDIEAAKRVDGFNNRWYLDPVLRGEYPHDMVEAFTAQGVMPKLQGGDLETISVPIDFLGINFYSRGIVGYGDNELGVKHYPPENPVTHMGWEVYPQALYDLLVRLVQDYGEIPLYITENGAAYPDKLVNGEVHDEERISYIEQHIKVCADAIAAGVPLKGYYLWSLLDNFEWAFGYDRRFGIVYVDFKTQKRYLKDSAKWYGQFIAKQR